MESEILPEHSSQPSFIIQQFQNIVTMDKEKEKEKEKDVIIWGVSLFIKEENQYKNKWLNTESKVI